MGYGGFDAMSFFFVIMGVFLLLGGIVAALKIGVWVWIFRSVFGPRQESATRHEARSVSPGGTGGLDAAKKWLSVVATVLGIVSTSVGLVKGCTGPSGGRGPTQAPAVGHKCCTQVGACTLMVPSPVGTVCTCLFPSGGAVVGQVCK